MIKWAERGYGYFAFLAPGFFSLTPAPPPFSSMNSTPEDWVRFVNPACLGLSIKQRWERPRVADTP
jgi:hypothetical protein